VLAHLHPAFRRPAHELARHAGRVGDPVLAADDRAEDVAALQHRPLVDGGRLDRDAERPLLGPSARQVLQPRLGRRQEQVPDLLEERCAELLEEAHAAARETHLRLGRELLADAPHRPAGRAARDLGRIGEHHVVGPCQCKVVGD
jgi:hypothetical protein